MKFGSLFSGIGGFDLGFERSGMECVWQCEIDKPAQSILDRHFGAKIYDDVRAITRNNTEPVDLICGGFPCQDVSVVGKRKGLDGERSGLWFEFARIIDELEPGWVVIENVPGLLSSNRGNDFAVIVRWLAERGYCVAWRILDAQYFGVAQRRRRVFIVGSFGNGRSAEILFESEGMCWNPPARGETGKEIAGETVSSIVSNGDSHTGFRDERGLTVSSLLSRNYKGINADNIDHMLITGNRMTAFGEYVDDGTSSTLKQRDYKDATDLVICEMNHAAEAYRESGNISPTLQARMGTGGNNIPLVGVRRLTPTECERLQGFPDGWTDNQSDTQRYKQLGNAVCVPVSEWIGKRIMEIP